MIIAMVTVRVMQVPCHQVVDMIAVGYGGMTTVLTVNVSFFMATTVVLRSAIVRVGGTHFQDVLIDMVTMHMVEMTIMQVIGVAVVNDGNMTTIRPVLMAMTFVGFAGFCHERTPLRLR